MESMFPCVSPLCSRVTVIAERNILYYVLKMQRLPLCRLFFSDCLNLACVELQQPGFSVVFCLLVVARIVPLFLFFFLSYTLFLLAHHTDVSIELLDHYSWGFPGQLLLSYEEANAWDPIIGHEGRSTLNGS